MAGAAAAARFRRRFHVRNRLAAPEITRATDLRFCDAEAAANDWIGAGRFERHRIHLEVNTRGVVQLRLSLMILVGRTTRVNRLNETGWIFSADRTLSGLIRFFSFVTARPHSIPRLCFTKQFAVFSSSVVCGIRSLRRGRSTRHPVFYSFRSTISTTGSDASTDTRRHSHQT